MKPPMVLPGLGRRAIATLILPIVLAFVLAACGDGLSLVAVNPDATPLPFKTPRVDEDAPEAEAEATGAAASEFESDTQPAIEVDAADAPPPPDPDIVETESPTAAPTPAAAEAPVDTDLPDAADAESWLIAILESTTARNIAIRAHEVGTNLLVASETADPTTYFDVDLLNLAFATDIRSFYGVLAFTALPPVSEEQILSPLLFFEQIVVHGSAEDAIRFGEVYQAAVTDLFVGQGTQLMEAALPDVFQPGGAPEVTPLSTPQFADEVIFLAIDRPVNLGAELAPRLHIALIRQGNITAVVAVGSSDESQVYRFVDIVERLVARMR